MTRKGGSIATYAGTTGINRVFLVTQGVVMLQAAVHKLEGTAELPGGAGCVEHAKGGFPGPNPEILTRQVRKGPQPLEQGPDFVVRDPRILMLGLVGESSPTQRGFCWHHH